MPPLPDLAFQCGDACAGFPSPAEDHLDAPLDLRALMMPSAGASFTLACEAPWACGGEGFLVFRKAGAARPGHVVAAIADGLPMIARVAGGPSGSHLEDGDGGRIRCGEARVRGVAAWAARNHAGGARLPSDGLDALSRGATSTYLFRVSGWSMRDAGIHDGDILVVDRDTRPTHGHLVLAVTDGARSVKRLIVEEGRARLDFDNAGFAPYVQPEGAKVDLFGVVAWGIRRLSEGAAA